MTYGDGGGDWPASDRTPGRGGRSGRHSRGRDPLEPGDSRDPCDADTGQGEAYTDPYGTGAQYSGYGQGAGQPAGGVGRADGQDGRYGEPYGYGASDDRYGGGGGYREDGHDGGGYPGGGYPGGGYPGGEPPGRGDAYGTGSRQRHDAGYYDRGHDAPGRDAYDDGRDAYDGGRYGPDTSGQFAAHSDQYGQEADQYAHDDPGQYAHDDPGQYAHDDPGQYAHDSDGEYGHEDVYGDPGRPGRRDRRGRQRDDEDWGRGGEDGSSGPDGDDAFIPGLGGGRGARSGGGRRRRRIGRVLAPLIAIVLLCVLGGGGYYVFHRLHSPDYSGPGTGEVTVQVRRGDSAYSLAPRLVKLGVVASVRAFESAAKSSSNPAGLEPGYFRLHRHMNAALAYKLLLNPKSRIQTTVTIPDGLRATAIIALLAKRTGSPLSQFQQALANASALGLPAYAHGKAEGYLYPDTYDFPPGTTPAKMLQTMVAQYNAVAAKLSLASRAKKAQFTVAQVITEASILEAEVRPADYAKVARVIDNRLNIHMTLGLDSTIEYALGISGHYNLTAKQLNVKSPYNTRLHLGLPPGPIDSPGELAIEAVLRPTKGDWLYFVTVDPKTGLTKFTNSYSQFLQWSNEASRNIKNGT